MPKLTDLNDADQQYDPYSNQNARDLYRQENDAGTHSTGSPNDTTDTTDTSRNIDAAKQAEEVNNQFGWNEPKASTKKTPTKAKLLGTLKKRGPLIGIGGGLIGASSLLLMFLSPSMLLLQMSDVLNSKFNDQLAALDARSTLIMKKKLGTQTTKGFCGTVTIKCKYRTISKNQSKRLKAAGLEVIDGDGDVIDGRGKPSKFRFQGRDIEAKDLLQEARNSPALRSALRKGYNPSFAAWADANAYKVLSRFGIKKSSSIDPSSDKEKMRKQLKEVAKSGDMNNIPDLNGKRLEEFKDDDGNTKFKDSTGNIYSEQEGLRINSLLDESRKLGKFAQAIEKSVLKNGVKGVLTTTAFGAGAVDSLCSVWNLVRIAGFAAKVYQQRQLIRYAYEFQKQADMLRSGDGKAELSTFFGDLVTTPNSEGKSGTDSLGYQFAAYGDVFEPGDFDLKGTKYSPKEAEEEYQNITTKNEAAKYVNGQLISTSMMAKLAQSVSDSDSATVDTADKTCSFVKSASGQALVIGLAVVGIFAAVFSGGASLGWGAALQGAAAVTMSVTFALLQPKLIDMAKGEVIKGDENGNEAVNAIVSGSGALNAQASQSRAIPVQEASDYVEYADRSQQVAADYAEVDRYERGPFDPTSKNTFIGSIVASVVPFVANSRTVGSAVTNTMSFLTTTASGVISPSAGAEATTKDQFSKCDDHEYEKWNLAADPFCNLRYGMSDEDLAIDPETVVDKMLTLCNGSCITSEEDPTALPGSEYEKYIKICVERETSIGDGVTNLSGEGEGGGDAGEICVDGRGGANEDKYTYFRLMYIDTTIDEGMESDFQVATDEALTGGSQFVAATLNVWGYSHSSSNYKERMDASIENLQSNGTEVAGLQEFQPKQREYFLKKVGTTYAVSPSTADYDNHLGDNSIIWDKSRFQLVEEGVMPKLKYFDGSTLRAPWVRLKDVTTQQEFFVLNTHDPARPENAIYRKENADQHVKFIDTLKAQGLPVVFTGDFNSGFSVRDSNNTTYQGKAENLTYCILTKNETVKNTFDMQENRDVKCPNQGNDNSVDHIYVSPDVQLNKYWKTTKRGVNGNGSDAHDSHFADLVIPGGVFSTGSGTSFIIGTYNQKRSLSVAQHEGAMKNIINLKMDVVGTQEDSNPKFSRYKKYLSDRNYGVFPQTLPQRTNQSCAGSQAIFYNKAKFKFVKGEFIEYPRYPSDPADCGGGERTTASHNESGLPKVWTHTPIVWLQDVGTGQNVIVINTHGVANVELARGIQPAKARYHSAQIYVQEIQRLKQQNPGVPIFFTGDFNEGTDVRTSGNVTYESKQENLLFCMFAKTGLMKSADGPAMKCDPKYSIGGVDYIYVTPDVSVEWVKDIASGGSNSGPPSYSDHPVKYAQVTVPGSGGGSGGWVWPTKGGPITNGNCYDVPVSGLGSHAGMDINTPVDNLKVVAMSDGVVVQKNYGSASGNYILIKATDGTYYAYQHLKSIPTVTGAVKAGQEIGIVGKTGRVFLQSSKGHLHVTMAKSPTLGAYGNHPNNFDPMTKLKAVKPAGYDCTR